MKLYDNLILAFRIIKREIKKSKKNILILFLVLFFTIFNIYVCFTLKNMTISYSNMPSFRTILVDDYKNSALDKLKNIKHVKKVFTYKNYEVLVNVDDGLDNNTEHVVFLQAGEDGIAPEVIKGKSLSNKNSRELICPDLIVFDSDLDTNFKLTYKDYVDGNELLNTKLKISYNKYDFSLSVPKVIQTLQEDYEIVGLYDSSIYNKHNVCYTNSSNIQAINDMIYYNDSSEEYSTHALITIVDNVENVSQVQSSLESMNLHYSIMSSFNPLITMIIKICEVTSIILIIASLIIIYIYIKKNKLEEEQNNFVLSSLGYNDKSIIKFNIIKNFIYTTMVFLLNFLVFTIIYLIIIYFIKYKYIVLNVIKLSYPITLFLALYISIILFITIIVYLIYRKTN